MFGDKKEDIKEIKLNEDEKKEKVTQDINNNSINKDDKKFKLFKRLSNLLKKNIFLLNIILSMFKYFNYKIFKFPQLNFSNYV